MNKKDILEEIKNKFNKTMKILVLGEHSTFVDNSFFDDFGKLINISETLIAENKKLKEENASLKNKNSFDVYKMGQESQRSRIERDYIPKIKVREALKEEQERLKKGLGKFYNNDLGNSATRILQSLLEKE